MSNVYVLGEIAIGELDQFLDVFRGEGREKRAEHGCLHSQVFQRASEGDRVLVLLEWPDLAAFESFRDDPSAPPIMRKGGAQGPPTFTVLDRVADLDA